MNIYLQNKTAKEAGVIKEIDKPLDPTIDKLFCWNVALVKSYEGLFDNVDTLIIKNAATEYSILVPEVSSLNENIFEFIKKYIFIGIQLLDIDDEIKDYYFKKAGQFNFGLINGDNNLVSNLRLNAIDAYAQFNGKYKAETQYEAAQFLTKTINSRKHYRHHELTFSDIMTQSLVDLYNHNRKGKKAYELLISLDVEIYKVTRRIIVPADITFFELHNILNSIFEWWNYHLANFTFFKDRREDFFDYYYKPSDLELDLLLEDEEINPLMKDYILEELMEKYQTIIWHYDYGDDWFHKIDILNIYENYLGEMPYLLEAEHSAPPEDVGGTGGFQNYLKIINNPNHEDYEWYKSWRKWKPELTKKKRTPHKIKYKNLKL